MSEQPAPAGSPTKKAKTGVPAYLKYKTRAVRHSANPADDETRRDRRIFAALRNDAALAHVAPRAEPRHIIPPGPQAAPERAARRADRQGL